MSIGLNCLIEAGTIKTNSIMDTVIEDFCYTSSMLNNIAEMNLNYRIADKEFYKAVYESKDLTAVNEAFIDFFTKVKEIIKNFLKYIKTLLDRFITVLHRMVGSEKYLLKHEDILKKFNTEHEFDFDGYEFTIEPNIPVCNALVEFDATFVDLDFTSLKKGTSKEDQDGNKSVIKGKVKALKNKLENDYYDEIRAKVIGRTDGSSIYESDYNNELFEVFRGGADSTSVFTVTSGTVLDCLNDIKNYKKVEKDVKDKKKDMENQYEAISKKLDKMINSTKKNGFYTVDIDDDISSEQLKLNNDAMNQLNLYVKTLTDQISRMTTIHSTAFSYKLDAIKDQYEQDKRILYIAMSKIQKDKEYRKGDI